MNLETTVDEGFLRVHVTGEFVFEEANDCLVTVFEAIEQHKLQRVLVDCRQLSGEPTTIERFFHATFAVREMDRFADKGVFRGTRFSYLGHEPLIDRNHFGATVATNRGLIVKVSMNEQDALQWLKAESVDETAQDDSN